MYDKNRIVQPHEIVIGLKFLFVSDQVGNPKDRFCSDDAQLSIA